jgi:hypothetical protein
MPPKLCFFAVLIGLCKPGVLTVLGESAAEKPPVTNPTVSISDPDSALVHTMQATTVGPTS